MGEHGSELPHDKERKSLYRILYKHCSQGFRQWAPPLSQASKPTQCSTSLRSTFCLGANADDERDDDDDAEADGVTLDDVGDA